MIVKILLGLGALLGLAFASRPAKAKPAPRGASPERRPATARKAPGAAPGRASSDTPSPDAGAGAPSGMGEPGTPTGVSGYADKGEQTFGPDDTVTPAALGTQFDLDTEIALPGNTTLPTLVRLTVVGYRWVEDGYRYVVSNTLTPTLYGFTAYRIMANLERGAFRRV